LPLDSEILINAFFDADVDKLVFHELRSGPSSAFVLMKYVPTLLITFDTFRLTLRTFSVK